MGSGKRKKKVDNPTIRTPKLSLSVVDSTYGIAEAVADRCPLSFDVKLKEILITRPGVPVTLQKKGEGYVIKILESEIGVLNSIRSKMIDECKELGAKYTGEIIETKEGLYARFFRGA